MPVGGDILELQYSHPTLGSGTIYPKSNEDSTFDLGGFRSVDDANMIDGGGNMIDQMNRVRWSASLTVAMEMNTDNTLDNMVQLTESPTLATWTITHINGTVWKGTGKPVGDLSGNANNATFPLKISGSGKMQKII